MRITMWRAIRPLGLAGLLAVAACERADPRLENLTVGISKDSAVAVMAGEQPKRIDPYLNNGQYIETLYFPRPGKTDPESLTDRKMTPLVVINQKLTGWGWPYWDSVATANSIQVAGKK